MLLTVLLAVFLFIALVCFAQAARLVAITSRYNLIPLGLFFVTLYLLLPLLIALTAGPHRHF